MREWLCLGNVVVNVRIEGRDVRHADLAAVRNTRGAILLAMVGGGLVNGFLGNEMYRRLGLESRCRQNAWSRCLSGQPIKLFPVLSN